MAPEPRSQAAPATAAAPDVVRALAPVALRTLEGRALAVGTDAHKEWTMPKSLHYTIAVALLAVHGACGPSGKTTERGDTPPPAAPEREAPTPERQAPTPERATPTVAEHMKDHFTQAIRALDAIIRGDLGGIKEPAGWLADHKLSEGLPDAWKPHVADLQNAARLALQANDIAVAADAMGAMGAACGRCHTALGATLEFSGMSPEGKESSVLDLMLRHQWAADRMWEGLVGPSELAWTAGVAALQDAPLHPEMLANNKSPPQAVVDLAKKVHALALPGKMTKDQAVRAKLYGEYVATCAACHSQLGVQLKPRP